MSDKELIELAAKAAGIKLYCCNLEGVFAVVEGSSVPIPWNPLTDDGDALRLAVKLCLEVTPYLYFSERCQKPATVKRSGGGKIEDLIVCFPTYKESFEKYDPYAATRRAIVRAAAEIGKGMK